MVDVVLARGVHYFGLWRRVNRTSTFLRRSEYEAVRAKATCRAQHKLTEAMEACGLSVEAGSACVDVGAAPGGWTAALADAGAGLVAAIDPAALALEPLPEAVQHLRMKLEEAIEGPLQETLQGRKLRCIVCDANAHPQHVAAWVVALAKFVSGECWCVLTFKKFMRQRTTFEFEAEKALDVMREAGVIGRDSSEAEFMHLLANSHNERTLVLKRLRPPPAEA